MFENEITSALTDMSDIPSYASVSEAVLYVLEANERNYNALKQEIGLSELGFFEANGTRMVYEAKDETEAAAADDNTADTENEKPEDKKVSKFKGKAKDIKDNIVKLISSAWAKIKGLFETVIRKISELVSSATNKIGKKNFKLETMKAGAAAIKNIEVKTYDYDNLGKIFDNGSSKVLDAVDGLCFRGTVNSSLKGMNREELEKWFRTKAGI